MFFETASTEFEVWAVSNFPQYNISILKKFPYELVSYSPYNVVYELFIMLTSYFSGTTTQAGDSAT